MKNPKVILIGGAPSVGKSTVARRIAARLEYGCLYADDIGKAAGAIVDFSSRSDGLNWQEYFTNTPVDLLIEDAAISRKRLWPAFDRIIRAHSTWDDPLVMEGYTLWPEAIVQAGFESTGAVWLACTEKTLESRIRNQKGFCEGAADEEALIKNFLKRSVRYNELIIESATRCNADVIHVDSGQAVDIIADLCISVLKRKTMNIY